MKKLKTTDDYIYISTIITIILMILFYIVYIIIGKPNIFNCAIYDNYHIYCPGCGCTRALISAFQGRFLQSLKYNPTVLYSIIIIGIYLITQTFGRILNKVNSKFVIKYKPIYIYIGLAILLITCITKNILQTI